MVAFFRFISGILAFFMFVALILGQTKIATYCAFLGVFLRHEASIMELKEKIR